MTAIPEFANCEEEESTSKEDELCEKSVDKVIARLVDKQKLAAEIGHTWDDNRLHQCSNVGAVHPKQRILCALAHFNCQVVGIR